MAFRLPDGFIAIKDATVDQAVVTLIGVVISIQEPKPTRGTDWTLNFTLQDDFSSGSVGGYSSISCRSFLPKTAFPKIAAGDVAILFNFRLSAWATRVDAISDSRSHSGMLVFPANRIPVPELSQAYQLGNQRIGCEAVRGTRNPTVKEQMAVIHMKHASSRSGPQVQQHAAATSHKATTSKKLCLIKDLTFSKFYDVRAEVVNIYYKGEKVDLKVTDYTSNQDLFYYADPEIEADFLVVHRGWKGPFGQLTLDVALWDSNATWARENVKAGDFVFLRNMYAKMSPANKLEGTLHQDKVNQGQVDIRKLINQADINEIVERREAYEKQRGSKTALGALQNIPKKSLAKASSDKKKAKKERLRAEKAAEQTELEQKAREWEVSRSGINANIRAAYPEMKLSTISDIIYNPHREVRSDKYNAYTLPFVNCRHRARVRVVDVFPPELDLFAHSMSDPKWARQTKNQNLTNDRVKERWEWGFVLLLEDAELPRNTVSEKLRVVVNDDAAQHLLNMNASDLKNHPGQLSKLKEKLFLLWGNLMELKTELRDRASDLPLPPGDNRLQNKPFDACIEEYGCEVSISEEHPFGYQRMHKLAQTSITG
ncbi:hypothetical protein EJ02DRAFT_501880 [Clathrospora elynae]|uniref:Protection of telomeres protein 1 n=1 Tax=Clathrospora elynae TaxID=706981 RepID=A0A6A5T3U0_9PLEO|nr:hypothetical protein EJ02DRAFT_501880 [Clathrospora elynae]